MLFKQKIYRLDMLFKYKIDRLDMLFKQKIDRLDMLYELKKRKIAPDRQIDRCQDKQTQIVG